MWDLRLVPAAIGSWLVSVFVWWIPVPLGPVLWGAVAGVVVAVSALFAAGGIRRRWWIWVTVLAISITTIATIWAVAPERDGPLHEAIAAGVIADVEVTVEGEVRSSEVSAMGPRRGPARYTARARLHRLESRLGDWLIEAPILLRVSVDDSLIVPGSRVSVRARLSSAQFTTRAVAVVHAMESVEVLQSPSPLDRALHDVRVGLRDSVAGTPPDAGALVLGLTVGDESTQPEGLSEAMRISGLAHLTAVSGGNVAIVLGVVIIIGRLLGTGLTIQAIVGGFALLGYVLIVGPEPSVLRAAGMGTVTVVALLVGGPRRGLSALSATIVVLLILAPTLAVSLGFSLSVAATAGLLVVAPFLRRGIRRSLDRLALPDRAREALADAIALTMAAQITTAPILATLGQGLSLVAVPANVLAAPAVAPVTVLGLLAAITASVLPPLAQAFGHLAAPFAGWIAWLARTFAALEWSTLSWPGGLGGALAAIVVITGVAAVILIGRARRWPLRTLAVVGLAALATLWLRPPDRMGWPPPDWVAVACDVGQGDAMVISTGPGRAIVVDAGPDPALIDSCLADLGIGHVDLLVLTHFHADHVEGTSGVLDGRSIDRILVSPVEEPVEQVQRVRTWIESAGLELEPVWAGESGEFGDQQAAVSAVSWQVLWPARVITEGSIPNNASIVLDVSVARTRLLLLGDVEPAAQAALRGSRGDQAFDVVKVAHHGSIFQDPRLAAWTAGRIAVISVGADNDYGHPAPETIAAWESVAARIMRTDQQGDIAIVNDAGRLGVVTRR